MRELGDQRVKNPKNDVTSVLVNVEIDGQRLTSDELASFFVLLVVAANESTREAISWGVWLLSQHPEQRTALAENPARLITGAVEEIIRWTSSIIYMRRTLAAPVEMSGQLLEAGSKIGLFYWSANRDERYFTNADAFDIRRSPNPHVAFSGPGPHFCLGAHLARLEITIMFRELLCRLPDLHAAEPIRLTSMFLNGSSIFRLFLPHDRLTSAVQFIEVFTIVLAIEVPRDWRAAVAHTIATLTGAAVATFWPSERSPGQPMPTWPGGDPALPGKN